MLNQPTTIMEYLEYFITRQRIRYKRHEGITYSTFQTYQNRERHLRNFLCSNKLESMKPIDITIHFIREYEHYLLTEASICHNYIMKCVHLLDNVLDVALEDRVINSNPAKLFKYTYIHNDHIKYLELEDVNKLINLDLSPDLNLTRSYFLFGCYTGLSFCDIQNFSYSRDTFIGPDKRRWIHIKRTKTSTDTYLPLLNEAKELLQHYNYQLPKKSNQKINKGIKKVAELAGLRNDLTSHVARKTFGNIMHNELNVPIETVSKMLGHRSVETTQRWYVRTNIKRIANDMNNIVGLGDFPRTPKISNSFSQQASAA